MPQDGIERLFNMQDVLDLFLVYDHDVFNIAISPLGELIVNKHIL
jgi:hypothetical protein